MSASKWTAPPFTRFRLQSQETSAEKLARAQENIQHAKAEAERTRLELIAEAERLGQEEMAAILEQERQLQEEIEKEKKAEEEAAQRRIEAEEAKKKAEVKRKSNVKGKKTTNDPRKAEEMKPKETSTENQVIHVRGRECTTDTQNNGTENMQSWFAIWEDSDEQPVQESKSSKSKKDAPNAAKTMAQKIGNKIVTGSLYPTCVACNKAAEACQWKMSVIHLRLAGHPNKGKNCEACIRRQVACQFIWEKDEILKRRAEETQNPESSKRVKLECPELVSCMEIMSKNIEALTKLTAAQALDLNTSVKDRQETLESIRDSLEGLRQKSL